MHSSRAVSPTCFVFDRGFHTVTQADLELGSILLPQSPWYQGDTCTPPLEIAVFATEPRPLCMLQLQSAWRFRTTFLPVLVSHAQWRKPCAQRAESRVQDTSRIYQSWAECDGTFLKS